VNTVGIMYCGPLRVTKNEKIRVILHVDPEADASGAAENGESTDKPFRKEVVGKLSSVNSVEMRLMVDNKETLFKVPLSFLRTGKATVVKIADEDKEDAGREEDGRAEKEDEMGDVKEEEAAAQVPVKEEVLVPPVPSKKFGKKSARVAEESVRDEEEEPSPAVEENGGKDSGKDGGKEAPKEGGKPTVGKGKGKRKVEAKKEEVAMTQKEIKEENTEVDSARKDT
jgi:hypothetical protein